MTKLARPTVDREAVLRADGIIAGKLPPALLTMANYPGTLAAVRSFGRAGIRVTTADPSRLAVSAWSKFTTLRMSAPDVRDTERFVKWLIDFSKGHDKHVLLPTSDDTAWIYSRYRDELSKHFYLNAPRLDVVYGLLNKRQLNQHGLEAGLDVARTWFPETPADLARCSHEARFPVMVKPQTQVMFGLRSKGARVESPDQLERIYNWFLGQPHHDTLLAIDPSASRPLVQEFYSEAATGIYNVSAFADRGRLVMAGAARKLLQQPRRLGVGVCFQEEPVLPHLAAGLERLVARLGFSGVFEAEFIQTAGQDVLIDFNPRFYNQMAFDIARGLPLPLLAYFDALGDRRAFDALCASHATPVEPAGRVYVDILALRVLLSAQRMSGALSREERDAWTQWYESHRDHCTYAVLNNSDRKPFWFHTLQFALRLGRHPRNFYVSMVMNKS